METYDNTETVHIYNNLIYNNHSDKNGGGIAARAGHNFLLYHNTIHNNTATINGSNINLESSNNYEAVFKLFNNIISCEEDVFSTIGISIRAKGNFENNLIQQHYKFPGNNYYEDPLFKEGTFELKEESPCIGMGLECYSFEGEMHYIPEFDFHNQPRPNAIDKYVDLGAIESEYEKPSTTAIFNFNQNAVDQLKVTPNPITDFAQITMNNMNNIKRIEIIDVTGKVLKVYDNINSYTTTINCSDLNNGIYILRVDSGTIVSIKVAVK